MIKIFSTFAKDTHINPAKEVLAVINAGPAFFIKQVLEKNNQAYDLQTGDLFEVEILLDEFGEHGRITSLNIQPRPIIVNDNEFVIVSTIGAEWFFTGSLTPSNRVFLDIQGFARANRQQANSFDYNQAYWENIFCLKGTKEEIQQIPIEIVENQKNRLLIISHGREGAEIYYKNERFLFNPETIVDPPNTIGAGDTFLTNLAIKFQETDDLSTSVTFAMNETSQFLAEKSKFK